MKEAVQKKSADEGLSHSRLPLFSEEEKKMIKGAAQLVHNSVLLLIVFRDS